MLWNNSWTTLKMIRSTHFMKKFFSLLLLTVGIFSMAYAQKDPQAESILAGVSKKYRSFKAIRTDFTFSVENKQANIKNSEKGTLYVDSKANKYKVVMRDKDLISDGKTQWTYLKEDKEVQVNNASSGSDALNPATVFTMYEKGYKYLYTGERKVGAKVYQMIDLSPIDSKVQYFKIRLSIDKLAKQIANVQVFDKNGSVYAYGINKFVPNVTVPAGTFSFDAKKYPGVEVVDLR